jgi:hypothetical protein
MEAEFSVSKIFKTTLIKYLSRVPGGKASPDTDAMLDTIQPLLVQFLAFVSTGNISLYCFDVCKIDPPSSIIETRISGRATVLKNKAIEQEHSASDWITKRSFSDHELLPCPPGTPPYIKKQTLYMEQLFKKYSVKDHHALSQKHAIENSAMKARCKATEAAHRLVEAENKKLKQQLAQTQAKLTAAEQKLLDLSTENKVLNQKFPKKKKMKRKCYTPPSPSSSSRSSGSASPSESSSSAAVDVKLSPTSVQKKLLIHLLKQEATTKEKKKSTKTRKQHRRNKSAR